MGKLNYTNRKISGGKLGAAVKRDVLKCIVQAAKPARSVKDPHIELNLQGKSLCDEGLELACEGLTKTLDSGCAKLDELNLSENKLTLAGLSHLTPVVKLAGRDLKDLDLRCNDIRICTDEDAEIWERFLTGFRDVCSLRRLDISENPLGDRGIEILLSVYARESPVIMPRVGRSTITESSEDEEYNTDSEEGDSSEIDDAASSQFQHTGVSSHREFCEPPFSIYTTPSKSTRSYGDDNRSSNLSPSTSLASGVVDIRGLRSIPYLIISKTELTDKAALFLSYILPIHPTPDRLLRYLPPTRPGFQSEILDRYDHFSGCSGIVYQKNEQFTSMGLKVLELAEHIRDATLYPTSVPPRSRQVSDISNTPLTPLRPRKESLLSSLSHSPHINYGTAVELERARSKIQGALLKESGAGSIEVWRTALRMLAISRTILFDKGNTGSDYFSFGGRSLNFSSPTRSGFSSLSPVSFSLHASCLSHPQNANFQQHHPHILDVPAWDSPNLATIGDSTQRKDTSDPPSPTRTNFASSVNAFEQEEGQQKGPESEQKGPDEKPKGPKDLPGNLPEDIWVQIITLATDPKDILSAKQRRNVVGWARTSDTLERERELAGKPKPVQVWRLLEGLECLSCEI